MKVLACVVLCCSLAFALPGTADEELDALALAALEERAAAIESWSDLSASVVAELEILRNGNQAPPVLSTLGPVSLHLSMEEVERILGGEYEDREAETGWRWSYPRGPSRKLVIHFDGRGRVVRIFSNSDDFEVPDRLSVGHTLAEFSNVYGSRRFRRSTSVSRRLKLIKYPLSNLAIVVDLDNELVRSLMIYAPREQ